MSLFSERLKRLRGDLTQTEAAIRIGITAQTLARYENGQRKPNSEVIVMLCKCYGVSADYLLGLYESENEVFSEPEASEIAAEICNDLKRLSSLFSRKAICGIYDVLGRYGATVSEKQK